MFSIGRTTEKRYYRDLYLQRCAARIVKIADGTIELDATVAYPEGGGQEADTGTIRTADGRVLRFVGAKKIYGTRVVLPDFPDIQAEGIIQHIVNDDDLPMLTSLAEGDQVEVAIDVERRARLSLSHTASHFVYAAVGMVRPDAVAWTLGCHIKTDGARFDFGVKERFQPEHLDEIGALANAFVARRAKVELTAHAEVPDARYWTCESAIIPCGGTHIDDASLVGPMRLRRKALGAGKERISCEFPEAVIDLSRYHG